MLVEHRAPNFGLHQTNPQWQLMASAHADPRRCDKRMKLIALVTEPKSIVRYLTKLGEPIDVPTRYQPRSALLEEHRPAPQGRGMTASS